MSPLLEIDSSLDPEKTLYRTIDFFSACQIIEDRTLMFPRADTFHDKNEGVERLLAQLEAYTAGGGCGGMGWSDATTAQREHERLKRSHFVSCWSTNPDSVAMWSLYSTDFQAVRVATKVKHLNATAEKLLEKYDVCRFDRDDLGSYVVAAMHGRIAPVQYESLAAISRKVSRKAEAHRRIELRYKRLNLELPRGVFRGKESMLREHERSISALNGTCYLKDTSFKHEEEIRVVVRIGMAPCNEKTLEMKDYSAPDHKYHL